MFKYKLLICLVVIFSSFTLAQGKMIDKVVAVVNGDIVTLHELNKRLESSRAAADNLNVSDNQGNRKKQALESMINDILLKQEADRLQITVSDTQVENRIEQMLQARGASREQFEDMLEQRNMSLQDYKSRMKDQIKKNKLLTSMVRQKVVVTEQEIKEFYNKNAQKYLEPKKCTICTIVMQEKDKLQELVQRMDKGEISFKQAAQKHSLGPATDNGGCLGSFKWSEMKKDWKRVVRELDSGEVSRIISLDRGYAVFMLESELTKKKTPLQEVRDEIRDKIYSRKLQERYEEYVDSLRSEAVVEVKL